MQKSDWNFSITFFLFNTQTMKKVLFAVFWFTNICMVLAQEPPESKNDPVDAYIDEFLLEEESLDQMLASFTDYSFLYLSVNYNSDTYFSGRDIDIDQYNIVPQLTYMHSKGFYAGISGIYYEEFSPHWDVTTLTAGYGNSLGKKKLWRYFGSYSHYFYANDYENLYNSTINAGLSIRNKNRNIGTQLSGAYYFGDEVTYQIVSRTFAVVNVLKSKKHHIKLRPQLSIVAGTQIVDLSGGSIQKAFYVKQEESDDLILQNNVFGLINTQVNLPLQYHSGRFDLEFGYNLNFPSELEGESGLENTGFFNAGIGYLIDL